MYMYITDNYVENYTTHATIYTMYTVPSYSIVLGYIQYVSHLMASIFCTNLHV